VHPKNNIIFRDDTSHNYVWLVHPKNNNIIIFRDETICFMSLDTLKKEILESINFMSNHICNCVLCNKTYKFNEVTTHLCNKNNKFININIIKKIIRKIIRIHPRKIIRKHPRNKTLKLTAIKTIIL
jgi:hypothetical protein